MSAVGDLGVIVDHLWKGKTTVPGENYLPVPLCPPQMENWPDWDGTEVLVVSNFQPTAVQPK
jgi:hypothetical protein